MAQSSSPSEALTYRAADIARLLGLAALYALLAVLVLRLFSSNGMVSIVWPPSGLAVAAILLGGRKYAPGIWLGAWTADLLAGSAQLASAVIALGNTLEALTAVWLLARAPGFDPALRTLRDLLRLIFVASFLAAAVSALTGASTLLVSGFIGNEAYWGELARWWVGDALGIIVVTPLLLVWRHPPVALSRQQLIEAVCLLGISLLVGQIVFLGWFSELFGPLARGYWIFLLLLWAAVRLGTHGVTVLLAIATVQGLWGAYLNTGYFAGEILHSRLTAYWGYTLVLNLIGLTLAIYIDGLKRSEARLRQSEESLNQFSLAVHQSSNLIVITNEQAEIEFVNDAFTHTTGYALDEVRGQNARLLASGLTPPDTFTVLWQTLTDGHAWRGELINRRKDGAIFVAEQMISPIRQADGRIAHYLSILQDITEQKQLADELKRHRHHLEELVAERTNELKMAEMRTRLILESTADGLFGTDNEGCFSFVNPAACRLLGYTAEQLIGQPAHATIHHSHSDGSAFPVEDCPQHKALFSGNTVRSEDEVYWRADGQPLPVALAGQPMLWDDKMVGTVICFTDVGVRKRAEAEHAAALAEAKRLAQVKSHFLANMSHEIRTPLNAVLGLTRICLRENKGRKSEDTCNRIAAAGEHLLGIINEILDFSKIEAGKLAVETHAFALAGVLDQVNSFVTDSATGKGLRLKIALADDLPSWVLGDALRLRQILANLLGNAIKFTNVGEVRLDVTRAGAMILFSIADTGIGMNAEQIEHLFAAFEQADSSTTRLYGGTGLGLAISRQLARLMGGDIEVSSILGVGSIFTLRVPLPKTEASERFADPLLQHSTQPGGRLAGVRLLAAEDIEVNRMVLADLLEQEGAQAVFAENGRVALDWVLQEGKQAFDCVLMDIQMPVMDGLEATRRLQEIAPDLPIIGLTAHALADERDKCLAAGMLEHITKPIDNDTLVAAILRQIGQRNPTTPAITPMGAPSSAADSAAAAPLSIASSTADAVIDWTALAERFNGRQDFIGKLLATVRQSQGETPDRLRAAVRQGDYSTIAFLAHAVKGVGGNIKATNVHELAGRTEAAARACDPDALALAEQLTVQVDALLAILDTR